MKKLCLLITVLVAATVARTADFSAVAPSGQTLYYNITSSTTVTLVAPGGTNWGDYTTPAGRLEIPSQVVYNGTTYNVTALAENALRQCDGLVAVTVPGSVKTIGVTAFFRCTALTAAHLAEGVETIGRNAFAACSTLDTIELPSTLRQIGMDAFKSTGYAATASNWDGSVLYIGQYVIGANTVVDSAVSVVEGAIGISNGAFYYCHYMPKVELPSTLQFIGNLAFNDCELLDTVVMHASVPPTLGDDAFTGVPSVTVMVPCGSGAAYGAAQYWSALDIVEDTCPVAVEGVEDEALTVAVAANGIVITGAEGKPLQVCDMMGRTVAVTPCASASHEVALPYKGIFLVTVDGISRKVAYLR
jgi:hypothetical protein